MTRIRIRTALVVCLPALLFAVLLVTTTVRTIRNPFQNFDLLGYVAAALHMEGVRGAELLEATRAELSLGIQDERKRAVMVTGISPYHKALMSDPRALEQQVPLYAPRVLYLGGIVGMHALGLSRVAATSVISALAMAVLAVLAWWHVFRRFGAWAATLVVAGAAYGLQWEFLGSLSTPDALAALFAIVGSITVLRALDDRRALWAGTLCFAAAVATRHDMVLHVVLFVPVALWSARGPRTWRQTAVTALVVLVPSAVVYALIAAGTGWYGRETVIAFSLLQPMPYPADTPLPDVWPVFWDTFHMELREFASHPIAQREAWPMYATLIAWPFARGSTRALMSVGVVEIVIRFALFPVAGPGWQRLYMASIVLTLWFAIAAILERVRATERGRRLLAIA